MHRSVARLALAVFVAPAAALLSGCASPSAIQVRDGRAVVQQSSLRETPEGRVLAVRLAARGDFSPVRQAVVVRELEPDGTSREVARSRLSIDGWSGRPASRRARTASAIVSLPAGVDAGAIELELAPGR